MTGAHETSAQAEARGPPHHPLSHGSVTYPDRIDVGPVQGSDRVNEALRCLLVVDPADRAYNLAANRYAEVGPRGGPERRSRG